MLFLTWSRLTLYFSVLLCWISSSIGHVFIYTPSLLIIRLEFTKKYLVNVFTFENLLFSACFRSLWTAFVCSLLLSVKLQCFTLLRRFKKTFSCFVFFRSSLSSYALSSITYLYMLFPLSLAFLEFTKKYFASTCIFILLLLSFSLDFVCFSFYRLALSL